MYVCACPQVHTCMHVYRMQFLARCLSNKEHTSDNRCERTNMAGHIKIFVTVTLHLKGTSTLCKDTCVKFQKLLA